MLEILAYVVLVAIFLLAVPVLVRLNKRASESAPAASFRTRRQRLLHNLSIIMFVPVVALVFSELGTWPIIALMMTVVGGMGAMRILRVTWRVRLAAAPVLGAVGMYAGAVVAVSPSNEIFVGLSPSSWLILTVAALLTAASSVLSILSFPLGHGERSC